MSLLNQVINNMNYFTLLKNSFIKVFLLLNKDDCSYERFKLFFEKLNFICSENCSTNGTTAISETLRAKLDTNYSFKLMNRFEQAFTVIIILIIERRSNKKFK